MRPVHDPYGGVNPLIDKMIGNAYDIVKYVARYLKEIRYVAEHMSTVYTAVHGDRLLLEAEAEDSTLDIALPIDFDNSTVLAVNAVAYVEGTDSVYLPGPSTFSLGVSDGFVNIFIENTIPALLTATYKVQVTVAIPG